MTRIEYLMNEINLNKGYEYEMNLLSTMTDDEICECYNVDVEDIKEYLPQLIRDFYFLEESLAQYLQ